MIKNMIKRKFLFLIIGIFIFSLINIFPSKNEVTNYQTHKYNSSIFLLDNENYLAKVSVVVHESTTISKIKEIINLLTINDDINNYIPSFFNKTIPYKTKLLDLNIYNDNLELNFNNNFINTTIGRKEIESIIYSITENTSINNIIIKVDGKILTKVPNSNEILNYPLTKSFGINKINNIDNIKDIKNISVLYPASYNNYHYYVPVTFMSNTNEDIIKVIITKLKTNPKLDHNLRTYLNASLELKEYKLLENEISLEFNDYLFFGLKDEQEKEEVKYTISQSIIDTLNIKKVSFILE